MPSVDLVGQDRREHRDRAPRGVFNEFHVRTAQVIRRFQERSDARIEAIQEFEIIRKGAGRPIACPAPRQPGKKLLELPGVSHEGEFQGGILRHRCRNGFPERKQVFRMSDGTRPADPYPARSCRARCAEARDLVFQNGRMRIQKTEHFFQSFACNLHRVRKAGILEGGCGMERIAEPAPPPHAGVRGEYIVGHFENSGQAAALPFLDNGKEVLLRQ